MSAAAGQTDYIFRAIKHIPNDYNYAFTRAGVLKTWPKDPVQLWNEAYPNEPKIRGPSGDLIPADWNARTPAQEAALEAAQARHQEYVKREIERENEERRRQEWNNNKARIDNRR